MQINDHSELKYRFYPRYMKEDTYLFSEGGVPSSFNLRPLGWSFTLVLRVIKSIIAQRINDPEETNYEEIAPFRDSEYEKIVSDELKKNFVINQKAKSIGGNLRDTYQKYILLWLKRMYEEHPAPLVRLNTFMEFVNKQIIEKDGSSLVSKAEKREMLYQFCARNGYFLQSGDKRYEIKSSDPDVNELPMLYQNASAIEQYKHWKEEAREVLQKDPQVKEVLDKNGDSLSVLTKCLKIIRERAFALNDDNLVDWADKHKEILQPVLEDKERQKRKPRGTLASIIYNVDDLMDYLLTAMYEILNANLTIKECEGCNGIFVAQRSDARFCQFRCTNPNHYDKSCKDHNTYVKQRLRIDGEILARVHEKVSTLLYYSKDNNKYEAYLEISAIFREEIRLYEKNAKEELLEKSRMAYLIWTAGFYKRKYKADRLIDFIEDNANEDELSELRQQYEQFQLSGYQTILLNMLDGLPLAQRVEIEPFRETLVKSGNLEQR